MTTLLRRTLPGNLFGQESDTHRSPSPGHHIPSYNSPSEQPSAPSSSEIVEVVGRAAQPSASDPVDQAGTGTEIGAPAAPQDTTPESLRETKAAPGGEARGTAGLDDLEHGGEPAMVASGQPQTQQADSHLPEVTEPADTIDVKETLEAPPQVANETPGIGPVPGAWPGPTPRAADSPNVVQRATQTATDLGTAAVSGGAAIVGGAHALGTQIGQRVDTEGMKQKAGELGQGVVGGVQGLIGKITGSKAGSDQPYPDSALVDGAELASAGVKEGAATVDQGPSVMRNDPKEVPISEAEKIIGTSAAIKETDEDATPVDEVTPEQDRPRSGDSEELSITRPTASEYDVDRDAGAPMLDKPEDVAVVDVPQQKEKDDHDKSKFSEQLDSSPVPTPSSPTSDGSGDQGHPKRGQLKDKIKGQAKIIQGKVTRRPERVEEGRALLQGVES